MSEVSVTEMATLPDGSSRPALQRTELGPLVHVLAHRVADDLEAVLSNRTLEAWDNDQVLLPQETVQGIDPNNCNYADVSIAVGGQFVRQTRALVTKHTAWPEVAAITNLGQINGVHPVRQSNNRLTNYVEVGDMLAEGVLSGVAMPFKLYGALLMHELVESKSHAGYLARRSRGTPRYAHRLFDLDHFVETLRSPAFNSVLHQLAHAPNGLYKSSSAEPTHTGLPYHFEPSVLETPYAGNTGVSFPNYRLFGHAEGEPMRLSDAFLEIRDIHMADTRRQESPSGGCPVRHAAFKKIGPTALEAFEAMGVDPANLPAESAISRYRRLVADMTERMVTNTIAQRVEI